MKARCIVNLVRSDLSTENLSENRIRPVTISGTSRGSRIGSIAIDLKALVAIVPLLGLLWQPNEARATVSTWTGSVSTDWNTAGNWNNGFPNGSYPDGVAYILSSTGNIATVTASSVFTPSDIHVGDTAGDSGRLDVVAGAVSTGNGNWMFVGYNSSNGTLNLANTTGVGGTFSGYGLGSGSITVGGPSTGSGRLWVGQPTNYGGTGYGVVNMNTSGVLNTQDSGLGLIVGTNGASGVFNLDAGTVNINDGGAAWFGDNSAASVGTLNMSGGVFNCSGPMWFGHPNGSAAGGTGILNLTGGTINTNFIGMSNSTASNCLGVGSGTIGAGAVLNSQTYVVLAFGGYGAGGASSNLVVNGTLNVDTTGAGNDLIMGQYDTANGNLTINSGATVRIANNAQLACSWYGSNSGTQVVTQNGGLVAFYSDSGATIGGSGGVNMNLAGGSGSYTYNLNGGTLQTPYVTASITNGSQTFNFNGGTLKATGPTTTFISNVGNVYIQSGGAVIDDSGYNITIPQNLLDAGGGLTKIGAGTLTLTGNNTYSGGTTINSGILNINADTALGYAAGPVTFAGNSTLQFGANNITLNSSRSLVINSGVTATIDTNGNTGSTIAGSITGQGSLATVGTGTLTLSGSSNYTGATTVNIGTLLVNGNGGGSLGATNLSVGANGVLAVAGAAAIGGNVSTTASGATINLQNGTAADTLNIGGTLSLHAGSVLDYDLGTSSGINDTIAVAGAVSLAPSSTINLAAIGGLSAGSYTLLTGSAGITVADFSLGNHPAIRGSYNFNNSTATALVLTISANATPSMAYWTGSGSRAAADGSNNWAAGPGATTNWSVDAAGTTDAGQVPGPNTSVYFTAATAKSGADGVLTTQLDGSYTIQGLTIAVPVISGTQITSTVIKPNGDTLTLGSGGLTLDVASLSSATIAGTGSVLLSTSQSWANNNSSLPLTVNASVAPVAGSPATLTFNGSGAGVTALNGSLSDATGAQLALVFFQAGVTQLNGSNAFTGGVIISSGTVQLGNTGALNTASPNAVTFGSGSFAIGDLRLNGNSVAVSALNDYDGSVQAIVENGGGTAATLTVNTIVPSTYNGTIQNGASGSLALTKASSSILYLAGSGTYTGGTNLNAGVLNFASGALPLSGVAFGGGTLQWASGNTQDVSAAIVPIPSGVTAGIDLNGNSVTFASTLTGSGSLAVGGSGDLTLSNSNTYSGTTTVSSGTVQVDVGGKTATLGAGNIVLGSAGTLVFDRSDSYTLNTNISGAGSLYQIGSGTLTLAGANSGLGPVTVTGSGMLTIAGSTGVAAGTITVGANTGDSTVLNILPGSTVNVGGAYPSLIAGAASGASGTINMTGGTLTTASELWLSSAYSGVGTMNMSGGVANIGSWLAVGRGGNDGVLNVSGGSLNVATNNLTLASFAGNSGTLNVSGGTISPVNSIFIGEGGSGVYNQTGGVLTTNDTTYNATNGVGIVVGSLAGSSGTLNITGGTISGAAPIQVWAGNGTINVSQTGSTPTVVNPGWITLGQDSGAVGTLTQSGGAITIASNELYIGYGGGATGSYIMHGGSMTAGDIRTDSGTGNIYQDGGTVTSQIGYWIRLGVNASAVSTYTLAGGTLVANDAQVHIAENGTGTLTIGGSNGGTMLVSPSATLTVVGFGGAGVGTLNLQSNGLLRTPNIAEGSSGNAAFNFSGGTLQNAVSGSLSVTMPVNLSGLGHGRHRQRSDRCIHVAGPDQRRRFAVRGRRWHVDPQRDRYVHRPYGRR